ncbi:MAG: hypothetical protein CBB78_009415 [Roseibacillus sp. TMED18]|nr:MAG: hypothetical protein CBB78_009415 [Roseibacillus sp. TMED18]
MTLTLPPITATATVTTMVAITTAFSATIILGFTKPITAIATPDAHIAATTLVVEDTAPTITPTTAITVSHFMEAIEPIMIEVTTATETTGWETTRSRTVAP